MDADRATPQAAAPSRPSVRVGAMKLAVDGAVPLGAFWVAHRVGGTVPGVLAAAGAATILLIVRRRAGRRGAAAVLSAGLVAVNAAVGLVTRDDVAYLAQGVATTALLGVAFGLSAATRRPLAGVLAADLYGLPGDVWEERAFLCAFRVISCAWAAFELLSAAARGLSLSSPDLYVAVSVPLGTVGTLALFWWSVRYAERATSDPGSVGSRP
jgi:hypothetical protein